MVPDWYYRRLAGSRHYHPPFTDGYEQQANTGGEPGRDTGRELARHIPHPMSDTLTHFDAQGHARMVDVAAKPATHRIAVARGGIRMQADTLRLIVSGGHRKGDVIGVARLAGIMAAKRTSDLVPLCHPIVLTRVEVELWPDESRDSVECRARVETIGPTGVEMEALTATQVALLTVYDMCKAVDRGMTIESVRLVEKRGGKSGDWTRPGA